MFSLAIKAIDETGNTKDAVYSYISVRNVTSRPLSVIVVDLNPDEGTFPTFASVNRATMQKSPYTVQNIQLVMPNAKQLENNCDVNHQNSLNLHRKFHLHLIDSSGGQVVCNQISEYKICDFNLLIVQVNTTVVSTKIQCCHVAYKYNSITGSCEFMYTFGNSDDVILRAERINKKYTYIRVRIYPYFYSSSYS